MSMKAFLNHSIRIVGAVIVTCGAFSQSTNRYVIGATFVRPGSSCSAYVSAVVAGGPADSAGLRVGDQLLVGDRVAIKLAVEEIARSIRSETPASVTLTIRRNDQNHAITIVRDRQTIVMEKQASELRLKGMKTVNGIIVPEDTTDAEVRNMQMFKGDRILQRVFPLHYPTDPGLYYGGFEAFILRELPQVAVGGVEDGPARLAGIHWGDIILSIDGRNPTGKEANELSGMLSSREPRTLHLRLDRLGRMKDIEIRLIKTADLLKQNRLQLVKDQIIPDALNKDNYLECLDSRL